MIEEKLCVSLSPDISNLLRKAWASVKHEATFTHDGAFASLEIETAKWIIKTELSLRDVYKQRRGVEQVRQSMLIIGGNEYGSLLLYCIKDCDKWTIKTGDLIYMIHGPDTYFQIPYDSIRIG